MMRWPLMWRSTHALLLERTSLQLTVQLQLAGANLQQAITERRYWQSRAERLTDHALFRRGEITAPVFQDTPPKSADPTSRLFEALRVTEIESQPPASPVATMT
jgi:hypothetical protein